MTDEEFMEHMSKEITAFDEVANSLRALYDKITALEIRLEEEL